MSIFIVIHTEVQFYFLALGQIVSTSILWHASTNKKQPEQYEGLETGQKMKNVKVSNLCFACQDRPEQVSDGEIYLCVTSPYKEL